MDPRYRKLEAHGITASILGEAISVRPYMEPGMVELIYEGCSCCGYRIDLLVAKQVCMALKW